MSWDGVPWYVDGSTTPNEIVRALAWAGAGGDEGIVEATDLRVSALPAPSDAVSVAPGLAVIHLPLGGQGSEAYIARMASGEQVDIEPTDSSGPRSDLIIARIEDPNTDSQWPIPEDPTTGPYVFTRVITGVPTGTTSIHDVRPDDSAITLARVDLPANTSSVTAAMVTDLRQLTQPRVRRTVSTLTGQWATPDDVGPITDEWEEFPLNATINLRVPTWATRAVLEGTWAGLLKPDTTEARGQLRVRLGDQTVVANYCTSSAGRTTLIAGGEVTVAPELRGTVQPVALEGIGTAGYDKPLTADIGTTVQLAVTWVQAPSAD
ncbi:hypothetical protein [Actinacidiphila sp. bgisy160]|uniref:hypothetical protein n=1 Tax=Actinacidiphila sp. bgisy160 TaxID=3413796 RepID=UPI003D72C0DB